MEENWDKNTISITIKKCSFYAQRSSCLRRWWQKKEKKTEKTCKQRLHVLIFFKERFWLNITCRQITQIVFTFLGGEQLSRTRPPSFDEIMAHLNYRGATSVPFVRSRGEIGFVQPASQAVAVCLPFKGGGWEIGAAAAAAAEWRINATKKKMFVSGDCGWLSSTKWVTASCFC